MPSRAPARGLTDFIRDDLLFRVKDPVHPCGPRLLRVPLDLDPERDATEWNAQLGLGVFDGNYLVVNDDFTNSVCRQV